MATIVNSVNETELQTAFDAVSASMETLWTSTAGGYLENFFQNNPSDVVLSGTKIILRSTTPGYENSYLVINGSGMGYNLSTQAFTGTVTSASLYLNATYSAGTVTGAEVVKATLSGSQIKIDAYELTAPGATTVLSTATHSMLMTGSTLPTSTDALSNLLGYDLNTGADKASRSGSFTFSTLTVGDRGGNKIEWTSTGLKVTVPAQGGAHGYQLELKGLGAISLTGAQIDALNNGSASLLTTFTHPITALTLTDTTTNTVMASVDSFNGLTVGKVLSAMESDTIPAIFTAADSFNASGAAQGVEFNFGKFGKGQLTLGTITGSNYDDELTGSSAGETILGGVGNDILNSQVLGGQNLSTALLWGDGRIYNADDLAITNDAKYYFIATQDSRFYNGATLGANAPEYGNQTNQWNVFRVNITTGAVLKVSTSEVAGGNSMYQATADGKAVVYYDTSGSLKLALLSDSGLSTTVTVGSGIWNYDVHATGSGYQVYYRNSSVVMRQDYTLAGVASGSPQPVMTDPTGISKFALSADGTALAGVTHNGTLLVKDNGNQVYSTDVGNFDGEMLGVSNDGRYMLFGDWWAGSDSQTIHLYDASTGADVLVGQPWQTRVRWNSAQLTTGADGHTYVVFAFDPNGDYNSATYRYDVNDGSLEMLSAGPTGDNIGGMWMNAVSADGRYVAMMGWNRSVEGLALNLYDEQAAKPGAGATDRLDGGQGNDTLTGGNGTSIMIGGLGADTLNGGAGADRFTYNGANEGGDVINGFQQGTDKIVLSWNSGLTSNPTVYSSYAAGNTANPASAFVYVSGSSLYYVPANHPGEGSAVLLATVTGVTLTSADIVTGQSASGSGSSTTINLDTLAASGVLNTVSAVASGSTFIGSVASLTNSATLNGTAGVDTLTLSDSVFDVSGMTLSSVEVLTASKTTGAAMTVSGGQMAGAGGTLNTIRGNAGTDTLTTANGALNLSGVTLSSVEVLKAGSASDTTFTVDVADLATNGSVVGNTGNDTLVVNSTTVTLTSTAVTGVEVLKAGATTATTFTVNQADLGNSVVGTTGIDILATADTTLDLSAVALSSIEVLRTNNAAATTFTVNQADLNVVASVVGGSGKDTIVAADATLDLSAAVAMTAVEVIQAGTTAATTITANQADLASVTTILGNVGSDTLVAADTTLNLATVTLSSIEEVKVGTTGGTTITLGALGGVAAVTGNSGADTLVVNNAAMDLSTVAVTGVETIKAGSTTATAITVNQSDLTAGGSVVGNSGKDTLVAADASLDLTQVTVSAVEVIQAGTTAATTFTVDQADLLAAGSVVGNIGTDTLVVGGTSVSLTGTTLSSVEVLKAGATTATTFTVDQADLAVLGSVVGTDGVDTLVGTAAALSLAGTTLSSIEVIKAGISATSFTVDQDDLASGGAVIGSAGADTLVANGASLNLGATSLSSVEVLKAGSTAATTFTVNQNDLGNSVIGTAGTDTLVAIDATLDLGAVTLSSVEVLKAGSTADTTFTLDAADLGTAVIGNSGSDTLVVKSAAISLATTAVSGVEVLKAGLTTATTFTVNQADLGNSVVGTTGIDTLVAADAVLDLSAVALSSVEVLKAGTTAATTFTVDSGDLSTAKTVIGTNGADTLEVAAAETALDLTTVTLSSIENLAIRNAAGASITLRAAQLAAGGSVTGNVGSDTLVVADAAITLTNSTLSGVEVIKAGTTTATTFTVDREDLAAGGSVIGTAVSDTLIVRGADFDLSGTTLSGIEVLKANSAATTFTLDDADLDAVTTIVATSGVDTIVAAGSALDLTATAVSGVEVIKVGSTVATTVTLNTYDVASNGSVIGNTGSDTVVMVGAGVDMSAMTLSGIEKVDGSGATGTAILVGGSGAQTLTGNAGNTTFVFGALADAGDTITNFSNGDKLRVAGTEWGLVNGEYWTPGSPAHAYLRIDGGNTLVHVSATGVVTTIATVSGALSQGSVDVQSIERTATGAIINITAEPVPVDVLRARDASTATTFISNASNLSPYASIIGSNGADTLQMNSSLADFSRMTLSSVDVLKANAATANTFTVSAGNLNSLKTVIGNTGIDTLVTASASMDLSAVTLTSVEVLQAGTTADTTFTVDQTDLASGGSVIGNTGADTLVATGASLSLTGTSLSSVEVIKAGTNGNTTFTVDQADLISGGSVVGGSGTDTLAVSDANVDLTQTTLDSVEVIRSTATTATVYTVDQADLLSDGQVVGNAALNTLVISGASLDLRNTTLSSIEVLKAGAGAATLFTVDQSDLAAGGSVVGTSGLDTLVVGGAAVDLSKTTLSSIEDVRIGSGTDSVVTVATLAGVSTLSGGAGNDTLVSSVAALSLASTDLSSIEVVKAGVATTTFTLDAGDLSGISTLAGSTGVDTLVVNASAADLTGVTLSSVEVIKAGLGTATTLALAQSALSSGGSVIGTAGVDTLVVSGGVLDLSATTLSSVEVVKAAPGAATVFTLDQSDVTVLSSVVGSAGTDTVVLSGASINLGSTALSGVEVIRQVGGTANTLTLTQAALAPGGTVIGTAGVDTLIVGGTQIDLSATTLSSIDVLKASGTTATTFTVSQSTLAGTSTVFGSAGIDTLVVAAAAVDLTAATLSGIEVIKAGSRSATTFQLTQSALAANGSVIGTSSVDTLVIAGTSLDLRATALSGVEVIKVGTGSATTITLDQGDLTSRSRIIGARGVDTLVAAGTSLDLTSTTLSSIEVLKAGNAAATTFTVDDSDLAGLQSVIGNSGRDTLAVRGAVIDLGGTSLSSVEVLAAASSSGAVFRVSQGGLVSGGTLLGGAGSDTLLATGTALNLSGTTLSGIEVIQGGAGTATTLTLAQANLSGVTSVIGTAGVDTLVSAGASLDLSATAVSGVEVLKATTATATTFTVNMADLGASVIGGTGVDTLVVVDAAADLSGIVLSSVEVVKAGGAGSSLSLGDNLGGTVKTVIGSAGTDSLVLGDGAANLSAVTLSGIEIVRVGGSVGAEATVSQVNLGSVRSLSGGSGSDTLVASDTTLTLTGVDVSGFEVLKASKPATTFTLGDGGLTDVASVIGSSGADVLAVGGSTIDLSGVTLSSIETVRSTASIPVTFRVAPGTLSAGILAGGAGVDTVVASGASLDLSAVALSSVEVIKAGSTAGTTFTVDLGDLAARGSVVGNSGVDTLVVNGNAVNLSNTTLSSIEVLQAGGNAATFTLTASDLTTVETLVGSAGVDTLSVNAASIDLTTTVLSGIEVIKAGGTTATTFAVDLADLVAGGSVIGGAASDTLVVSADVTQLAATTLSSVEVVVANGTSYGVRSDLTDGGGAANSLVVGTAAANTLKVSGTGSAALLGGAGDDSYELTNNRFASVSIADSSGSADVLNISGMSLDLDFGWRSADNNDLVLSFGGGKTVTVNGQYAGRSVETLSDRYDDYVLQTGLTAASGVNSVIVGRQNQTNVISAVDGSNLLWGGNLADTISGGSGADVMDGGTGNNTLLGGAGNDTLSTLHSDATTSNTLTGGAGDDTYLLGGVSGTTTTIDATGGGADSYVLSDTFGSVTINNGGGIGEIDLSRQSGSDAVSFSRSGNDLVMGFSDAAASTLRVTNQYGGGGVASVNDHGTVRTVSTAANNSAATGSVLYVGANTGETIIGSSVGGDVLAGGSAVDIITASSAGNSTLIGGAGNDSISAGSGGDTIVGGTGADQLTAGSGVTVFWYNSTGEGGDTISGFVADRDQVAVYGANFGGLSSGSLSSANFVAGTTATAAAAQFLYDSATQTLSFDADGTGAGAAVTIATLSGTTSLSATDIIVVNRQMGA